MTPAILTENKIVTGNIHADAFTKLTENEKNGNLISGFVDYEHYKFLTDDATIYLKEIILLRHAQSSQQENGPLTTEGCNQANKLAHFLLTMHLVDFFGFSSPYLRCQQTSQIINTICAIHFTVDSFLSTGNMNVIDMLDALPEKSILITHADIIENILVATHLPCNTIIDNCSITYINKNKLVWLAKLIL